MGAICSRPVIANDKLSRQGHLEDITVERSKEKLSRQRQLGDSTVEGSKEKISKNRVSTEITEIHRTGGTVFPNAVPRDNTKVIENSKDSPFAIQPGWTSKIAEHGTAAVTNTHNDHVTPTLRIIQSDESKVAEKRKTSPCLDEVSNDNEDIDEYAREYASDRQIQTALERIRIKAYDNLAIGNGECRSLSNNETITASKLLIQRVNWAIREVTVSTWKETNGEYTQSAKHLLHVFDEAYEFLLELKVPVEYVVENRKSIANIALNADIIERMCEMVITIYQGKLVSDINNSSFWDPLCLSMGILWNYTDTSEEWAERVANTPGLLDIIYKILTDIRTTEATSHNSLCFEDEKWILLAALGITHNLSMVDTNISALRDKGFTKALQPHLKSSNKNEHLAALSSLAGIINEEESEIINSNKKVVKHLMRVLKRALATDERRYDGWSCKESGLTIRMLGRNDANKRLLVQLGALPLLVQLAKGNTAEQTEAVNAIWVLSFDAENQKIMVNTDDLEIVENISNLTQSANDNIRKASNGTLWNLRDELRTSENQKYREIGKQLIPEAEHAVARKLDDTSKELGANTRHGEGHIMISYQWSNQKTLLDIRNELHKNGLKVWMDVDNMAGSTLQAMAEAVENADIVLLCYSQKFKTSPNCRLEAEYAFQRQRYIIPLRMERDYKPDGWLGILLGTKLFFDFTGKYEFKTKFDQLLVEVTRMKNELNTSIIPKVIKPIYHHSDTPDGAVSHTHQDVQAPPNVTSSAYKADPVQMVKGWTNDDIKNWIIKQNLPKQPFCKFTVDEIVLLLNMRREAPESFYTYLDKLFKSNFRVIAQTVRALEQIGDRD